MRITIMTKPKAGHVLGAAVLAVVMPLAFAGTTAAECTWLDIWPSFREVAPSAESIIIGEVVEGHQFDSADYAPRFLFRVDEVVRGTSPPTIDFTEPLHSGLPETRCPGQSVLLVTVGDVIAMALNARVDGAPGPVVAVAYIRGEPDPLLLPGVERISADEVRELAALPPTDTEAPFADAGKSGHLIGLIVLVGALASLIFTVWWRRQLTSAERTRPTQ